MNISKAHKRFSELLNNPEVLTNPEEFLGPNFEAVLNFWLWIDGLSRDQWETIRCSSWDFYNNQRSEWLKARDEAIKASNETIGWKFACIAADAAWDVYGYYAACYATRELIGMHKILEQQKPLLFIPLAFNFQTFI